MIQCERLLDRLERCPIAEFSGRQKAGPLE